MLRRLKNLYRSALSTELGGVGDEILRLQDQLEALIERYDRLQARIGMRQMRQDRSGAHGEDQLMQQLRDAAATRQRPLQPTEAGWPELEG